MSDTVLALEDPGALELDVFRCEVVEQAAPLPEEYGDKMELELVEEAGGERELRCCGAVNEHVLLAGRTLGLGDGAPQVVRDTGIVEGLRQAVGQIDALLGS